MKRIEKFPWLVLSVSVVLLSLSLIFKAYDMAVAACVGIFGSFIVFAY